MKNRAAIHLKKRLLPLALLLLLALLSACAVGAPPALTQEELIKLAASDNATMYSNQEPVNAPITLEEAEARAVKYNLQHRLALMEKALAENLTDIRYFSLLPKVIAEAGYTSRNNDSASSSESITTGEESLEPSMSRERNVHTAELTMTWNILDFGLSYYEAKALGNKALAQEERRRRVVSKIINQTKAAYWATVSAERMRDEVAVTLVQAKQAMAQSKETGRRRLMPPIVALRYQRDLLNMVRQLEQLDNELVKAKTQLASLMNLAPGTEYTLALPEDSDKTPAMAFELNDLESLAMVRRPELLEQSYLARNAVLQTRMAMLRMFPNASLFGGVNYDSNKYLVHDNWASAGVQVGWNLLKIFSLPAELRAGKNREQVASLRRQALRMTVLSQVHIAWHQRHYAQKSFERAEELCDLQKAIHQQTENAAHSKAENPLELIRTKVKTLLAIRARDLSYAELVAAQDSVYQAVGLDSMPAKVRDQSVTGLASAIAEQNRQNEMGHADVPMLAAYSQAAPANTAPTPDETQTLAEANAPVDKTQDATIQPSVRLVSGHPWESLGSLQGGTE